jgi:hypothetical protein
MLKELVENEELRAEKEAREETGGTAKEDAEDDDGTAELAFAALRDFD